MTQKYFTRAGETYGKYTVLVPKGGKSYCQCSCGLERWVLNKNLCTRNSPKCRRCFASRSRYPRKVVHAAYNAVDRCVNKDHKRYADWGGRGIKVREEWMKDIDIFCQYLVTLEGWDDSSLVLDRIDNNGDYSPGNLRWVTRSVSQKNRRRDKKKRVLSSEGRESVAAGHRGLKYSESHRIAISEGIKRYYAKKRAERSATSSR